MTCKKGFTLLEIIVVLIIVGIIAAFAIPSYSTMMTQGGASAANMNLITIYKAQKDYYFTKGTYCTTGNGCDNLADINNTLGLTITDSNFNYKCETNRIFKFTCTAQSKSINKLNVTITVNNNPLVNNPLASNGGGQLNLAGGCPIGDNPCCTSGNNNIYCPH